MRRIKSARRKPQRLTESYVSDIIRSEIRTGDPYEVMNDGVVALYVSLVIDTRDWVIITLDVDEGAIEQVISTSPKTVEEDVIHELGSLTGEPFFFNEEGKPLHYRDPYWDDRTQDILDAVAYSQTEKIYNVKDALEWAKENY